MKIESHNHPSAIEPYEGAATGVGGIVRDIFAMGAQPIALLDSLTLRPARRPRRGTAQPPPLHRRRRRNRRLRQTASASPPIGGELVVGESYSGNPLVNAMCLGVAPRGATDLRNCRTAGYED